MGYIQYRKDKLILKKNWENKMTDANNKLGEKLYKAGFKLRDSLAITIMNSKTLSNGRRVYYLPTLTELIKACGRDFASLDKQGGNILKWVAFTTNRNKFKLYADIRNYLLAEGKTPEEAVAKLWLKLQKIKVK
jgi:ribosomal protein S16